MSNEITTIETVQKYFVQDNVKEKFSEVLNDKAPQFMTSVVNAIRGNASLQKCEAQSIISSALVAATYDLPIDGNLGFSAIVPYGGKAQFQMMYKGFVQLAIRSGAYKNMHVSEVYEDEIETYNPITGELEFIKTAVKDGFRAKGNTDKIVGYYAMFKLLTGFQKEIYMTAEEVTNHAKKYSASYKQDLNKGWKSSRWTLDFDAMAKKTVLKLLLSKWGILSIDMQRAIQDDQKVYDDGGNSNYSDKPDSKPTELPFNPWENVVDAEVVENGVEQQ